MKIEELIQEGHQYGNDVKIDFFGRPTWVNESQQEDFLKWARKLLRYVEINNINSKDAEEIREKLKEDHGQCLIETYRLIISIAESLTVKDTRISNEKLLDFILTRFGIFSKQLNTRHDCRQGFAVRDEYDVQDLLHAQLCVFFEDVRAEDPVPINMGSGSRVDFLITEIKTAIEVKMTRKGLGDKNIGEQLLVDIGRYGIRNDIERLVFFIYDPDYHIRNPKGLKRDIEKQPSPNFIISVIIVN